MNRRGFLGSILAACAAPAIVRADSLMRIVPVEAAIVPAESALTEAALKDAIRRVWEAGGTPDLIRCSPDQARLIMGGFAGVAACLHEAVPSLSVYVSDYGVSRIVSDPLAGLNSWVVESSEGYALP